MLKKNNRLCGAKRRVAGNTHGFTLLEIMVALVLIAVVIVSVIQLSSANLRNLATADDQVEALAYANAKMREVLALEKLEDKSWNEMDDYGYSYEITIAENLKERTDSLGVQMKDITVVTNWINNSRKKQIVLKTSKMVSKADALIDENDQSSPDDIPDEAMSIE